jgi:hypothetical protein
MNPHMNPHMNKQMRPTEINVPDCGRPAMSVRERFIFNGLDKFDTLLGPNEAEIDSR